MNSAQSGRAWRLAPGRVSMRRMEHTRDVLVWSHHLKIVPWHWRELSYRPFEVGHHLSVRTGATQLLLYQNSQTLTHAARRPTGNPLQKPTVVQWDIGAMPNADGAADESVSPQSGITSRCSQLIKAHHGAKGYWNLPDLLWHEETREFIAKQANLQLVFRRASITRSPKKSA